MAEEKRIIATETVVAEQGDPCKTAEQMEQICCGPRPKLQCCEEVVGEIQGDTEKALENLGLTLDADGRDQDGRLIEIRWKTRKNPCGKVVHKYDLTPKNCCEEVEELAIDWESSVDVLEPGTRGLVSFTGGRLPVFVKIRGNGFTLDGYNTREAWAHSRSFYVYAHEFACGSGPITLDDGCSVAQGSVRATVGQWDGLCIAWSIDGDEPQNISGNYRRLGTIGDCGTIENYNAVVGGQQIYVRQDYSEAFRWVGYWSQWWRIIQGNLARDELDAWLAARLGEGWPQGVGPQEYAPNGPGDVYDLGLPVCSPDGSCRWIC